MNIYCTVKKAQVHSQTGPTCHFWSVYLYKNGIGWTYIFIFSASFAVCDPNVGLDTIGKQCIQTRDPELVRTIGTNENLSGFNWSWSYKIWRLSCFRLPADKSSSSMQTMGNCGNGWVIKVITRIFFGVAPSLSPVSPSNGPKLLTTTPEPFGEYKCFISDQSLPGCCNQYLGLCDWGFSVCTSFSPLTHQLHFSCCVWNNHCLTINLKKKSLSILMLLQSNIKQL